MPSDVAAELESWSGRVTTIRWIASAQEGIEHLRKRAVERVALIPTRLAGATTFTSHAQTGKHFAFPAGQNFFIDGQKSRIDGAD